MRVYELYWLTHMWYRLEAGNLIPDAIISEMFRSRGPEMIFMHERAVCADISVNDREGSPPTNRGEGTEQYDEQKYVRRLSMLLKEEPEASSSPHDRGLHGRQSAPCCLLLLFLLLLALSRCSFVQRCYQGQHRPPARLVSFEALWALAPIQIIKVCSCVQRTIKENSGRQEKREYFRQLGNLRRTILIIENLIEPVTASKAAESAMPDMTQATGVSTWHKASLDLGDKSSHSEVLKRRARKMLWYALGILTRTPYTDVAV